MCVVCKEPSTQGEGGGGVRVGSAMLNSAWGFGYTILCATIWAIDIRTRKYIGAVSYRVD